MQESDTPNPFYVRYSCSINVHILWSVLARLTFSAYLLHMPVVYVFNHLAYLQRADSAIALLVVLPGKRSDLLGLITVVGNWPTELERVR